MSAPPSSPSFRVLSLFGIANEAPITSQVATAPTTPQTDGAPPTTTSTMSPPTAAAHAPAIIVQPQGQVHASISSPTSTAQPMAKRLDIGTTKQPPIIQVHCYRCGQFGHVVVDCLLACKPFVAKGPQRCKSCKHWISAGDLLARPREGNGTESVFMHLSCAYIQAKARWPALASQPEDAKPKGPAAISTPALVIPPPAPELSTVPITPSMPVGSLPVPPLHSSPAPALFGCTTLAVTTDPTEALYASVACVMSSVPGVHLVLAGAGAGKSALIKKTMDATRPLPGGQIVLAMTNQAQKVFHMRGVPSREVKGFYSEGNQALRLIAHDLRNENPDAGPVRMAFASSACASPSLLLCHSQPPLCPLALRPHQPDSKADSSFAARPSSCTWCHPALRCRP